MSFPFRRKLYRKQWREGDKFDRQLGPSRFYGIRSSREKVRSFQVRGTIFSVRGKIFSVRGKIFSVRGTIFSVRGTIFSVKGTIFSVRGTIFSSEIFVFIGNFRTQTRHLVQSLRNRLETPFEIFKLEIACKIPFINKAKIRPKFSSCLTLIGKFLGNFWDHFTGKLIQTKCYN